MPDLNKFSLKRGRVPPQELAWGVCHEWLIRYQDGVAPLLNGLTWEGRHHEWKTSRRTLRGATAKKRIRALRCEVCQRQQKLSRHQPARPVEYASFGQFGDKVYADIFFIHDVRGFKRGCLGMICNDTLIMAVK